MMLKTSSRKINPFWNMIGFTIRKNLGIIIVLCIAALVYYPGTFIINYENLLVRAENSTKSYLIEDLGYVVTVLSTVATVLFNMLNFGFLYKKNSSDVFHSFPLKRSELLLSRFLSGLVSALIPALVCYATFGILMAFNSWMGNFIELLYYLLYNVIIVLVCSSFSMIFVVCAGSAFDLGISLIGANLALIAVGWIFESMLQEVLVGYNGYVTSHIVYNLSPPYFCGLELGNVDKIIEHGFINSTFFEFLIRSIIYIVIFTLASVLLYNRRKAEKGGTAYAYKFMYLGCSLLAGICGGFLLGMIFNGTITSTPFWIFAVIGCLLTVVVYGAVSNRGFKGVGKSIIMGALSSVILIAVAAVGVTGGFGYTTRIPENNKIKNASVSVFNENITFDDPQQILDLHQAILDTEAMYYDENTTYEQLENVQFYYDLENGRTMSRNFTVNAPKISDKLLDIYKSNERLDMIKEHTNIIDAEAMSLYFYYDGEYYNADITEAEAQIFVEAYWQDVQNCDGSIFGHNSYEFLELTGYQTIDAYRDSYFSFQLEWHDSFDNTKLFIENYDLVERSKKQQNETYEKY